MSDAPKNPDHSDSRRRQVGSDQAEGDADGRDVARALYGGITEPEREPTPEEDGTTRDGDRRH